MEAVIGRSVLLRNTSTGLDHQGLVHSIFRTGRNAILDTLMCVVRALCGGLMVVVQEISPGHL